MTQALDVAFYGMTSFLALACAIMFVFVIWDKAHHRGYVKGRDEGDREAAIARKSVDEYRNMNLQLKADTAAARLKLADAEERHRQNWAAIGVQEGWLEDEDAA